MCLYPRLARNKKYTSNKKNGGNIPKVKDKRVLSVPKDRDWETHSSLR